MLQLIISSLLTFLILQSPSYAFAEEVSLKSDLDEIEKLRESIPDEKREVNDELAFVLKLFEDLKRNPQSIQQEFNRRINKQRDRKKKELQKAAKEFTAKEKVARKTFLDKKKSERKAFLAKKPPREEVDRFFAAERGAMDSFFSDERAARKDFQSDQDSQRKELDNGLKDRRREFEDKLKEFKQLQKDEKSKKTQFGEPVKSKNLSSEYKAYLEEFDKIPKTPGTKLEPQQDDQ